MKNEGRTREDSLNRGDIYFEWVEQFHIHFFPLNYELAKLKFTLVHVMS